VKIKSLFGIAVLLLVAIVCTAIKGQLLIPILLALGLYACIEAIMDHEDD